ncbi:MAG: thiazole synthase, partial [Desulfotignum sp.]
LNAPPQDNILTHIPDHVTLLPNTSGARTAKEAVRIARIAREAGCGDFIKIEVITDMQYLLPDNHETLKASETLAKEDFIVLPNTAIATAKDPVQAGRAFSLAVSAGRMAYQAGMAGPSHQARASSPLTGFLQE